MNEFAKTDLKVRIIIVMTKFHRYCW